MGGSHLGAGVGYPLRLIFRHSRREISIAFRVMVPIDGYRRHAWPGAELVFDGQFVRKSKGRQCVLVDALNAEEVLRAQLEAPVRRPQDMNSPIADQTAAKIKEPAPVLRQVKPVVSMAADTLAPRLPLGNKRPIHIVTRSKWARSCAAQPQVPVQRVRKRRWTWKPGHFLRPTRPTGPGVDFPHFAYLTGP